MLIISFLVFLICSVPLAYVAQSSSAEPGEGATAAGSGSRAAAADSDDRDDGNDDFIPKQLASRAQLGAAGAWKESEMQAIAQTTQDRQEKATKSTYKSALKCADLEGWCKDNGITTAELTVEAAARFMLGVDAAQKEKKDKGEKMAAWSTIKVLHSALQDLWSRLPTTSRTQAKLLDNAVYSRVYKNLKAMLSCRIDDPYFDVTRGTSADCYTPQEYIELIDTVREQSVDKSEMVFWLSIMTFMHQCIARSDDVRILKFHHALAPVLRMSVGPVNPTVFSWQCSGNKNHKGAKHFLHLTRALDVRLCAVSNLGRLLYNQFTLGTRAIPNPATNWEEFFSYPLFGFGKDPVSYEAMRQRIKPLLIRAGIFISHVCHAFRAGGAQWADMFGAELDFIKRLGGWLDEVVTQSYVTSIPDEAVCAAAGVKISKTDPLQYWDTRFFVRFEGDEWATIEAHVFPWLTTLDQQWCSMKEQPAGSHMISIVKGLLAHIRGALQATVQDMAHAVIYPAAFGQDFIDREPLVQRLKQEPTFRVVLERYHNDFQAIVILGLRTAPSLAHKYSSALPSPPPLPPPQPAPSGVPSPGGNMDVTTVKLNDRMFTGLGTVAAAWAFYMEGRPPSFPAIKDVEQYYAAKGGKETFAGGNGNLRRRRSEIRCVVQCVTTYMDARVPDKNSVGQQAALQGLFDHLSSMNVTYKQFVDNTSGVKGAALREALQGGNLPPPSMLPKQDKTGRGKAKLKAVAAAKARAAMNLPSATASPAQRAAATASPAQRAAATAFLTQHNLAVVENAAPSPFTTRMRAMTDQELQLHAAQPCALQALYYRNYIEAGGAPKGMADGAFISSWELAMRDAELMSKLQRKVQENQVYQSYAANELKRRQKGKHGGDQLQQNAQKKARGGGRARTAVRVLDLAGAGASQQQANASRPQLPTLQLGGMGGQQQQQQPPFSAMHLGGSSGGLGGMGAQQQRLPYFALHLGGSSGAP